MSIVIFVLALLCAMGSKRSYAQNSMIGDGFGGRLWYIPHNYQVGAYSAYTVCGTNDQLYAWGNNDSGELGDGIGSATTVPIAVVGMTAIKFYTTGYITAAIKKDSTAWVWGYLSNAAGTIYPHPNPEFALSNVKFADGGISHVVFIKYDSTVWTLGQNTNAQLGNGNTNVSTTAVQMIGINNAVRAVAVGHSKPTAATIILLSDGTVKIAGGYQWFTQTNSMVPITLAGLNNIVDIKGNAAAAFALNKDGEVYAFGSETQYGSLGLGLPEGVVYPPTKITFPAGAAPIIALSSNNDGALTLALDENKNVYGWGFNFTGTLGDGTQTHRKTPVLLATNVIDIYAAETFSYILKADMTLWATGRTGYGGTPTSPGSIWMNLSNTQRLVFTQIDPTIPPMNLCAPKPFGILSPPILNVADSSCNLEAKMKIYPVPASQTIVIDKKVTVCKVKMNIYNSLGQLMVENKAINDGRNEIGIAGFASGVYFTQFISNGKIVMEKRIIKQ